MDATASEQCNVLLIHHLPNKLTAAEKQNLLQHFGATSVKCMPNRGRMKHTAFATFDDQQAAAKALSRLHQLKIMGHTLVVEFARTRREKDLAFAIPRDKQRKQDDNLKKDEDAAQEKQEIYNKMMQEKSRKLKNKIISTADALGLDFPINPKLVYKYPPPTVRVLANVVNALVSVPKFYNQVLHLMNKMNLPPPFGVVTQTPPIPEYQPPELPPEPPEEMEMASSTEESELESDGEEKTKKERLKLSVKRPSKVRLRKAKKMKLQVGLTTLPKPSSGVTVTKPQDVFEKQQPTSAKKMEMKLPQSLSDIFEAHANKSAPKDILQVTEDEATLSGGFGKLQALSKLDKEDEEDESSDEEDEIKEFVSSRELRKNRISNKEMQSMSVFKKYDSGEPTTRLYIKNLGKQCEQQNLKFIYGRYVDWESKMDQDMFSIQLMTQGRMKGQAFVSLPSEFAAKKALKDTNGYLLHGKAMVVQFARSSKPKEQAGSKKS